MGKSKRRPVVVINTGNGNPGNAKPKKGLGSGSQEPNGGGGETIKWLVGVILGYVLRSLQSL